jgi:drug/metabolite transporter (DMT)-like permease
MLLPLEWQSGSWMDLRAFGGIMGAWAGISGVLYYALAFWFYLQGLARVQASMAGVFINLIPIFGIGGAYLFLGERLAPAQWLGAGAILAAVFGIMLVETLRKSPQTSSLK